MQTATPPTKPPRRPRIALMGEFSAGKSTLANLLLGVDLSPVKVTATQLPPVWYRSGASRMQVVDNLAERREISRDELAEISHDETQAVLIDLQADVLEFCDLIDMPGTSDPNLPQEIWERMVPHVDGVVWCTPATQAWRQSEAALWEAMPERLHQASLLLVTRMDKLQTETDCNRVLARVHREAGARFAQVLPISLTQALAAGEEEQALIDSGADDFVGELVDLVERLANVSRAVPKGFAPTAKAAPEPEAKAAEIVPLVQNGVAPRRVVPRRVRPAQ